MKTYLILILITPVLSSCGQDKINLVGSWIYSPDSTGFKPSDCPDLMVFQADSSYQIFNDCESHINNKIGLFEKGKWSYKISDNKLFLYNREWHDSLHSDYKFHNKDKELIVYLEKQSVKILKFKYSLENNQVFDFFVKRKISN